MKPSRDFKSAGLSGGFLGGFKGFNVICGKSAIRVRLVMLGIK
jgi:hypothetical protein